MEIDRFGGFFPWKFRKKKIDRLGAVFPWKFEEKKIDRFGAVFPWKFEKKKNRSICRKGKLLVKVGEKICWQGLSLGVHLIWSNNFARPSDRPPGCTLNFAPKFSKCFCCFSRFFSSVENLFFFLLYIYEASRWLFGIFAHTALTKRFNESTKKGQYSVRNGAVALKKKLGILKQNNIAQKKCFFVKNGLRNFAQLLKFDFVCFHFGCNLLSVNT